MNRRVVDVQQPSSALDRLASGATPPLEWSDLADERDRIARDLHDIVVQRLFLVGLRMARSAGQHPEDSELTEILDDIDRSIADLRAVIYGLQRPRAIIGVESWRDRPVTAANESDGASSGLQIVDERADSLPSGVGQQMISRIVADLADLIGHRPELEIDGDIDGVDDGILGECAVVVRELLINALKHANSSQTLVSVSVAEERITVVVEDDGDGVRTLHPAQGGTGLRSLSERARRNGGAFRVEPRAPRGTRVRWSVPVRSRNE